MQLDKLILKNILLYSPNGSDLSKLPGFTFGSKCKGGVMTNMQPFQKITDACKTTGLSAYYLRKGCKDGTIPHIKSGGVYYINVPALLRNMETGKPDRRE